MKLHLIWMRNFPGNIRQCIKGHLIYLYDQRREGMRVKQRVWKGICNQEPSPIYFTSPKPLLSILFFQLPQQPSYLRASLPLSCTILIAFYLFFLNCNLDCITHPLIDLKLFPHYLSNYKLLGLHDPWKSHTKLFFFTRLYFSSQSILCYLQTQLHLSLQISHLLLCHLIFTLTFSPL